MLSYRRLENQISTAINEREGSGNLIMLIYDRRTKIHSAAEPKNWRQAMELRPEQLRAKQELLEFLRSEPAMQPMGIRFVGERQGGKSTVLRNIRDEIGIASNILVVYVSLDAFPGEEIFFTFIKDRINDECEVKFNKRIKPKILPAFCRDMMAATGLKEIWLLLDEGERLTKDFSQSCQAYLKGSLVMSQNLRIVLAGSPDLFNREWRKPTDSLESVFSRTVVLK